MYLNVICLLVFFRLIFDQGYFRVRKFAWLSIFWGSFLGFPTVILILFKPEYCVDAFRWAVRLYKRLV